MFKRHKGLSLSPHHSFTQTHLSQKALLEEAKIWGAPKPKVWKHILFLLTSPFHLLLRCILSHPHHLHVSLACFSLQLNINFRLPKWNETKTSKNTSRNALPPALASGVQPTNYAIKKCFTANSSHFCTNETERIVISPLCGYCFSSVFWGVILVVVVLHCKYHDEDPSSDHGLFNNLFPIYRVVSGEERNYLFP